MAESTYLVHFALFYCLWGFVSGLNEVKEVEAGQNALLNCQDSSVRKVEKLVWIKSGQETKLYVFFYRENRIYENVQDTSFQGRVKLSDPALKDGNVSLILTNTTINDTGTYECHIVGDHRGRHRRAVSEVQHVVKLTVKSASSPGGLTDDGGKEDGGKEDGVRAYPGLIAGISVMFLYVAVLIVISKTHKKEKSTLPAPPDKEAEQQLV